MGVASWSGLVVVGDRSQSLCKEVQARGATVFFWEEKGEVRGVGAWGMTCRADVRDPCEGGGAWAGVHGAAWDTVADLGNEKGDLDCGTHSAPEEFLGPHPLLVTYLPFL